MSPGSVICLVGMPGSGKSTVGRLLARRLGHRFVDLDDEVERRAGVSIAELFTAEGEAGFRDRERRELETLLSGADAVVVATGGGVVTEAEGRRTLAGTCCVWLRADPDVLARRVGRDGGGRPLLADDPAGRLAEMAAQREPAYREVAGLEVDTSERSPSEVVDTIVEGMAMGRSGP